MSLAVKTFSHASDQYVASRPLYPPELFEWLASRCARRDVAWDCATGNGQAAIGLAPYVGRVYATDISSEQIDHGIARDNVEYSVQPAEATSLASQSVDLVTVAQALHWFDYSTFWPEVVRVARDGALFAAWGYDWLYITTELDRDLVEPFREIVAPFWALNNHILWNGYRDEDIAFPFERIETPVFSLNMTWTLGQTIAYMKTWSAYKRSRADAAAVEAMDALLDRVVASTAPDEVLTLRMTLKMVAGYVKEIVMR
jgi:SAM-dependent methyltransferase